MSSQVKLVFPVSVQIKCSLVSDNIEETLTSEEYTVLSECYNERIPLRQCLAFARVYSRIEESVVYKYSLYDSENIDTMDSFLVNVMYSLE